MDRMGYFVALARRELTQAFDIPRAPLAYLSPRGER
jgi:hypothetical protein